MSDEQPEPGKYAKTVHEETQDFIRSLLAENRELRELTARLESAKADLAEEVASLKERLTTARVDLETQRRSEARLEEELAQAEATSRRYSTEYVEVERHSSSLANLYVASYRLHGTLCRREVLDALEEIIVNLIGSEEYAILECGANPESLEVVAQSGMEPARLQHLATSSSLVKRCARTGELYSGNQNTERGGHDAEAGLTACIPLRLEKRVFGVIAISRLLPHKAELARLDLELFELLATQTASALYLTQLHAVAGAGSEVAP